MAERLPAGGQFRPPDVARLCRDGRRRRVFLGRRAPRCLLVIPLLVVNWFGDSLDGTRGARAQPRAPALRLLRGSRAGRGRLRGALRRPDARRTHERRSSASASWPPTTCWSSRSRWPRTRAGRSRCRSAWLGPTELRILLAAGTLQLMRSDVVTMLGHSGCCSTSAARWVSPASCSRSRSGALATRTGRSIVKSRSQA